MGNCDSSTERKHISKLSINNDYSTNFSSPSLPSISSSSKIIQKSNINNNNKRSNSTEKKLPSKNKQYILSENISKREDISQKYKLSKQILGDGATSIVYVAEEISSKKKFAIKRIIKEKILTKQNNVIKESEICLKLKNKNIVNYYEIYEDIHFISIVMELGDTDLFELITKSPLRVIPDGIAIDFLIQIFESIDYLHNTHNIVHCDIKPENYIVKFDKNNRNKAILKLIDFGNIRRKPINKERLFNFCGTKEYMAPETLENYGFNEKVDEWAAGVIMFNLLTGADPFASDNDSDYKDNIKFKNIKFDFIKNNSLRELNKKLLNRFIDRRITAKEALEEIKKIKDNLKLRNIN